MKQKCRRCKKPKDYSEFYRDSSMCKACQKVDAKRYYKASKLKKYNEARQREKFPDFGRKAIGQRVETALLGTISIFKEI